MESQLAAGATATDGSAFNEGAVTRYYSAKTNAILHKYGPGPRVHFHVGLFDNPLNTTVAQHVLKQRILTAQEAILDFSAQHWGVPASPPVSLLDVGCGLGGGSIYWAEKYGIRVTGLTNAPEHVPLINDFARQTGVADRVIPRLTDVHHLQDLRSYDAAVALESSGYMDRDRLFSVMAQALKPGGWFGIEEHFLCRPEWAAFIDSYYKTRLGTLTEYINAARAAGFVLEHDHDLTDLVTEFWVQSMAWSTMELDKIPDEDTAPIRRERLIDSAITHGKFFRVWREHAVETRLLLFRLPQAR